jgi:hypothetical protein
MVLALLDVYVLERLLGPGIIVFLDFDENLNVLHSGLQYLPFPVPAHSVPLFLLPHQHLVFSGVFDNRYRNSFDGDTAL